MFGSLYWGKSNDVSNELGMIRSVSKLYSSAFGIGFMKSSIVSNNDKLILTVDQPIRIESGRLQLNVPTYRTKDKKCSLQSNEF